MSDWFNSSLGQALLNAETERCTRLLPAGYYPHCLQVGLPQVRFTEGAETGRCFVSSRNYSRDLAENGGIDAKPDLISRAGALPFAEKSMNLIYLPHTLDFCIDPHAVLREVNQILAPEGCVVITGFNKLSMWGGLKLFHPSSEKAPWQGNYYRVRRVQDWISLLGFDLVGAGMMNYLPPLQSEKWRNRLAFLDKVGDRWWPGLGGVYVIVGRKRQIGTHSLTPKKSWQQLIPGMVKPVSQPAARHVARTRLKLVPK